MESKFVQAGAVSLQYYEEGSGPETIVLVHGYASSAVLWRYTIEQLAREQMDGAPRFRIIAFNNRGAGIRDGLVRRTDTPSSLLPSTSTTLCRLSD